jgi:hypothetical protein
MTEPTPRTDNPETGYRSHYAEHEHNRELCRSLERQCARQFALLRRWVESAKRDDACDLTCLIIESERELKG